MSLEHPLAGSHSHAGTAYAVHGRGEPLVLVHGVGMQQGVWSPQIEALAASHQVIVYDMLGHGASQLPPPDATLADYAAQLAALLDHLGLSAANVAGHSMGALVALEFALRYPARTLRLAALNAVFQRSDEQRAAVHERAELLKQAGVQATVDTTIARWFGEPVPEHLQATAVKVAGYLDEVQPVGYARTYHLFATSDCVHAGRLAQLGMPALFMTGEYDTNSSPAMSEAMAREVPGSELDIVPGARHMMNVTDPERINSALQHWLQRPLPGSVPAAPNAAAASTA